MVRDPKVEIDVQGMQVKAYIENGNDIPKTPGVISNGELRAPIELNHPKFKGYIAAWGSNNLFPQDLIEKIKKSSLLRPLIERKVDAFCSGGVVYGYLDVDEKNQTVLKRLFIDEIERDLERSNVSLYLNEVARDWYTYNNAFPHLILDQKRSKIVQIISQDTSMCRLSLQQKNSAKIEYCIINANWKNGNMEFIQSIPVIDHYFDATAQIKRLSKAGSAIIPLRSKTLGAIYYDDPIYNGIFESGWYDIHMEIPKFKKALMEKRVNVALEVAVNYEWWEWKYKDFSKKSDAEKKKIIKAEADAFMKEVTDPDKRLQILMTGFGVDPITRKENFGWIIKPIKLDEHGEGYLEDSQEADLHIMRAMGLHSSMIGIASKNGLGAGSGSDMKMAYDQFILGQRHVANRLLSPVQAMFDFNGYSTRYKKEANGRKIVAWSESYFMARLNNTESNSKINASTGLGK